MLPAVSPKIPHIAPEVAPVGPKVSPVAAQIALVFSQLMAIVFHRLLIAGWSRVTKLFPILTDLASVFMLFSLSCDFHFHSLRRSTPSGVYRWEEPSAISSQLIELLSPGAGG